MSDDCSLSISTEEMSYKEEAMANEILGQFYSLEKSIMHQNQVWNNFKQNPLAKSDEELMEIDESSRIGSDKCYENFDIDEEEESVAEERIEFNESDESQKGDLPKKPIYESELFEYETIDNIDEDNIENRKDEHMIIEDEDYIEEQDNIRPFVLPKNFAAEIPIQQERPKIYAKNKQKRTGQLTMGLTYRIRTHRAAENFARFRAFQDGISNGRCETEEYPTCNQIINEWGIGLIISAYDPSKAILRKQQR